MSKPKILIVDDEIALFSMLNTALSEENEIFHAESGEQAIETMKDLDASIILLDIRMGKGIDGYETCRQLRKTFNSSQVHIIFLSGLDREQDILAGYEAGGDDFVVKPFKLSTLSKKIALAKNSLSNLDKIKDELSDARSIMFNVMGISSELGQIIHFLTFCNEINTNEDLAKEIGLIMESWQLECTVQIRMHNKVENFSLSGAVKPLEAKIIETVYNKDRIYHIKDYTFFNHENITIFIKNMPRADPEKDGNFKDNIAILAEGANSRLLLMLQTKEHQEEHEKLTRIAAELQYAVVELDNLRTVSKQHISESMLEFKDCFESFVAINPVSNDVPNGESQLLLEKLNSIRDEFEQTEQSNTLMNESVDRLMALVNVNT